MNSFPFSFHQNDVFRLTESNLITLARLNPANLGPRKPPLRRTDSAWTRSARPARLARRIDYGFHVFSESYAMRTLTGLLMGLALFSGFSMNSTFAEDPKVGAAAPDFSLKGS